jgi:hypothetical protein
MGQGWLPRYVKLTDLDIDEAARLLLASAAIPYAVRRVFMNGQFYADGGIIDNIPLNKALEFDCDLIIVVYLTADVTLPQQVLGHIPRLRRAINLASSEPTDLLHLYHEWLETDEARMSVRPFPRTEGGESLEDVSGIPWYEHLSFAPSSGHRYEVVPCTEVENIPEIVHVIPSQPLGGLLRGTLNFSSRKSRKLFALGYADMHRVITEM